MQPLEVFFDYACPYCLKGHQNLEALLSEHPGAEVLWRPCEAHPRPEQYGPHSDLCIQGMFFAMEQGANLWAYHRRMYDLSLQKGVNIEDPTALAAHVGDLLDAKAFLAALQSGAYREAQLAANRYAYEKSGVWAVPSYRMGGKKLDAVENVGVLKADLKKFWDEA